MAFFPELETGPCRGCPCEPKMLRRLDVKPFIPEAPIVIAVTPAPEHADEFQRQAASGPAGRMLRAALADAGVERVGYASLLRCWPEIDDVENPRWKSAERRCRAYLDTDLAPGVPLLLLGQPPLRAFAERERVGAVRGMWLTLAGRDCFIARDPAQILAIPDARARESVVAEFGADIRRMADRLLAREPEVPFKYLTYESPAYASVFLDRMAATPGPWAFDIETYDAGAFPSRRAVATDPCHPDFRLRGIAFAWKPDMGAWVDCKGWESRMDEARALLAPVFASPAEKWAFFGHFDEEGLVAPGWVLEVRNRAGDGGLALIALSDGTHESLKLERAVVDVLGRAQYWGGFDKGMMRDAPIRTVAVGAVGDACHTFALCEDLHGRLERGEHMTWRK